MYTCRLKHIFRGLRWNFLSENVKKTKVYPEKIIEYENSRIFKSKTKNTQNLNKLSMYSNMPVMIRLNEEK